MIPANELSDRPFPCLGTESHLEGAGDSSSVLLPMLSNGGKYDKRLVAGSRGGLRDGDLDASCERLDVECEADIRVMDGDVEVEVCVKFGVWR